MSGFWPAKSPMKSASSSASRSRGKGEGEALSLIDCPKCRVPVVQLRSKKPESYRKIFYKCSKNYPVSVIHTSSSDRLTAWSWISGLDVLLALYLLCVRTMKLVVTTGGKLIT